MKRLLILLALLALVVPTVSAEPYYVNTDVGFTAWTPDTWYSNSTVTASKTGMKFMTVYNVTSFTPGEEVPETIFIDGDVENYRAAGTYNNGYNPMQLTALTLSNSKATGYIGWYVRTQSLAVDLYTPAILWSYELYGGPPYVDHLLVNYTCNTGVTPMEAMAPYDLVCVDGSDAYPAISAQNWTLSQPDGSIYKTANATLAKTLTAYGWYELEYEACNTVGCGYANTTQLVNLSATPPPQTGISLLVDIKDAAFPNAFIQGASFGILNTTSGEWGNTTATYGALELSDIKGIKLSSNQTVQICAKATGYPEETCDTFAIPYDGYLATLYLTKTGDVPSGGNWNLIVTAKKNIDGTPLNSATIEVWTGVSGPGYYSAITDNNGVAVFMNVSASTLATIRATAQGYQPGEVVKTVFPNTTQYHTFSLVRIGQTPVATPIPTTTYTYVATPKPGDAYPVPTDAYGNPITDEVQKGYAAWGILIDAAYAIMGIVVGLIFIWLLWMSVYLITGGDIIQKIMRRGRR